jgi:hypothetical protein
LVGGHEIRQYGDMRVSVIRLTTAGRGWLSIRSVLRQNHDDLEVIVVDDGSTDDMAEALAGLSDPRKRVIRHDAAGRRREPERRRGAGQG